MKSETPFLILAIILFLFANIGLWLTRTVYNPQNFSDLVVETFQQEEVRNAISSEIVDNSLESRPLVKQVLDDPVKSAISGILGSRTFVSVLDRVAERFQVYLTSENRQDVTVEVGQFASFIKSAGNAISPELGAQVPDVQAQTITLIRADSLPNLNKWLKPIVSIGPVAGLASMLLLIYLFYKSMDRGHLIKKGSLYFVIGIVLFALLVPYFRTLLQGNIVEQNAQIIATATYDAFLGVLTSQLLALLVFFGFTYLSVYFYEKYKTEQTGDGGERGNNELQSK